MSNSTNRNTTKGDSSGGRSGGFECDVYPSVAFIIVNSSVTSFFILCYLVVIGGILLNPKILKNYFNILLLSLALLDVTELFYQLITTVPGYFNLVAYAPYIWIEQFFWAVWLFGPTFHNLAIAANRLVSIVKPAFFKRINTLTNMLCLITFLWIATILFSWPITTSLGHKVDSKSTEIGGSWDSVQAVKDLDQIFVPAILGISLVMYVCLFIYIRRIRMKVGSNVSGDKIDRNHYMILFQAFYIALTQALSLVASYCVITFFKNCQSASYYFINIACYLTFTANPIMYVTICSQFKETLNETYKKIKNKSSTRMFGNA